MQMVPLGRTGVRVSQLAMGTMSFGGDADESESRAMFRHARNAGINFFDTADVYSKGTSETILGRLIADSRDELVIATKAYFPMSGSPNDRGSSRFHLVRAVEGSLRRLNTDRIDVFYLHRFDDDAALDETLRAVEDLVRAGKILYPAVSNFAAWQTTKALGIQARHSWAPLVAIQPMYNLLKRQAEVELLPMAHSESLGVFPYSPLAGGLLTGKYVNTEVPGRIRDVKMYATRYGDPSLHDIAQEFAKLAREIDANPVALAIAWVGSHPAVTAPLLGARNTEQLKPALAATEIEMSEELRARISALSPTPPPATDRNEEGSGADYATRLKAN